MPTLAIAPTVITALPKRTERMCIAVAIQTSVTARPDSVRMPWNALGRSGCNYAALPAATAATEVTLTKTRSVAHWMNVAWRPNVVRQYK